MTIHARKMGRPSSFQLGLDRLDRAVMLLDEWRLPRTLRESDRLAILALRAYLVDAQALFARANLAKGRLT